MIFGIICVIYFILIGLFLGRWNSKFPRFWLALGAVSILCSKKAALLPDNMRKASLGTGLFVLAVFLIVEVMILLGMRRKSSGKTPDYIIILGAKVDGWNLTDALRQRLDKAVEYLKEHSSAKVIVSGGQGEGENMTEACAMARYLLKCQIGEGRILKEEKSTTTRENLIFSSRILLEHSQEQELKNLTVGIVTNDYHIYRAVSIAGQVGYGDILPLPAPTTPIMFANYMVREFFGVVKMWLERKKIK